jgi:hypothetical protein
MTRSGTHHHWLYIPVLTALAQTPAASPKMGEVLPIPPPICKLTNLLGFDS